VLEFRINIFSKNTAMLILKQGQFNLLSSSSCSYPWFSAGWELLGLGPLSIVSMVLGREHKDHDSNLVRVNNSQDPILKILNTKKGWHSGSNGRVLV
jgi:hypothetical protein